VSTPKRIVIIGGGIAGCSLAYHLAQAGWTDVVLVEKGELTSGSTWHAAGLLTQFNSSRNVTKLQMYSLQLYRTLEATSGQAVDLHTVGSVRLASTDHRMDEYRRARSRARSLGLDMRLLSSDEIGDRWPIISTAGLVGGLWIPDDGYVDPSSVTLALAAGARVHGVTIRRRTTVTGLRQDGTGWVVETDAGPIECDIVVNASGMWAPRVAAMAGVALPIVPLEHHMVVTADVPELKSLQAELPVIRDPEASFYVRAEVDAVIIGPFEKQTRTWAMDGVPWDFAGKLLTPDPERIEPELLAATERIPALADVGLRRFINGPDGYTPDGRCLMGWTPGVSNFFQLCGFSIFGIVSGGGAGKYAAEWIVDGQPSDDLWELDVRRFGPWASRRSFYAPRALDVYGHEYAIGFPHEERPAGRPQRTDPLYDRLIERGAVMGLRSGWERPLWFAPPGVEPTDALTFRTPNWVEYVAGECRSVRSGIGVLDQSSFAKFDVQGSGARAYLDRICCNRIPIQPGRVVVAPALTPRGGVECDLTVTCLAADHYYVVGAAAAEAHDLEWLQRHAPGNGTVTIDNVTDDFGVLTVAGPRSREVLQELTDADLTSNQFRWMRAQVMTVAGVQARALRVSYVGELGWELHLPIDALAATYEAVLSAGADHGIVDFGYRALDSMRIEKGYRLWGSDMNADYSPLEAGLESFVDFDKGDFIGRESLLAQLATGLTQRLATLVVECDDAIPLGGEAVRAVGSTHGEKVIGYVSAAERGHVVGAVIAHAYLPTALTADGSAVQIDVLGEWLTAAVVNAPLYDPGNVRLRS